MSKKALFGGETKKELASKKPLFLDFHYKKSRKIRNSYVFWGILVWRSFLYVHDSTIKVIPILVYLYFPLRNLDLPLSIKYIDFLSLR
jgi:hypothetical protein